MSESKVRQLREASVGEGGQIAPPIASRRPLYIFSLDAFCRRGRRIGGPDAEYDDEVVVGVADTLMALNFAGAECWIVTDRPVTEVAQTADWLARNELGAAEVYMGYAYGTDTGLDAEDLARLKAIFERVGNEGRWEGLPVYTFNEKSAVPRIILG